MDTGDERGTWVEKAEVMSEVHVGTAVGVRSTVSVFAISMPSGLCILSCAVPSELSSRRGRPVRENEEGLQGRASSDDEGDHHGVVKTDKHTEISIDEHGDLVLPRKAKKHKSGEKWMNRILSPFPSPLALAAPKAKTMFSVPKIGRRTGMSWSDEWKMSLHLEAIESITELPHRAPKNTPVDAVVVHHHVTTLIPQVGLQIWRGALLLSDFILHMMCTSEVFNNVTALELGSGTGLAGLVMGRVSPLVFVTDRGEDVLENCSRNVIQNVSSLRNGEPTVRVRELDWKKPWPPRLPDEENCRMDKTSPYQWTPEDIKDAEMVSVLLAADVVYSEDLTAAFFEILKKLMPPNSNKVLFLALEKRYNFSLTDLDVVAHGYKHFRTFFTIDCPVGLELDLASNEGERRKKNLNETDSPYNFFGQMIDVDEIPQYVRNYSRGEDLELWEIRPLKDMGT